MKGLVIKSTGSWYKVRIDSGEELACRLKGNLRLQDSKLTNPVSVGDWVEIEGETDSLAISKVHDRRNYVIRKSNNLSKQAQVIASNLDVVLLFVTLVKPRTSLGFIDRYLTICELYGIEVVLFFNKLDLYNNDEIEILQHWKAIYKGIGYHIIEGSLFNDQTKILIKNTIQDKTCLLAGHSGVGKSSWLNKLVPGITQKTSEISDAHFKGRHTTTFAEMFQIDSNTYIIDTPGIKDFGVVDAERSEVQNGFKEFKKIRNLCRFNDCLHIDEPDCAILKALNSGSITESRYYSYISVLTS